MEKSHGVSEAASSRSIRVPSETSRSAHGFERSDLREVGSSRGPTLCQNNTARIEVIKYHSPVDPKNMAGWCSRSLCKKGSQPGIALTPCTPAVFFAQDFAS